MSEDTATEATTQDDQGAFTRMVTTVRLADGQELTVETGNPDTIRWEQTAARRWPHLLPDMDERGNVRFKAPMFMQTFVTWAALKRNGLYAGEFEQFSEHDCLELDTQDTIVRPTQPGHTPG